jgi:arylsulfatase A-like enzyme
LYKQNQHEGGISSPLIVHWPEGLKAKPGSITRQPGHLIDFMATFIELSGAKYPKQVGARSIDPLEGKSLLPIIQGKERAGHENLYFHFVLIEPCAKANGNSFPPRVGNGNFTIWKKIVRNSMISLQSIPTE